MNPAYKRAEPKTKKYITEGTYKGLNAENKSNYERVAGLWIAKGLSAIDIPGPRNSRKLYR